MSELKTKKTRASVKKFLGAIADEQRREDCSAVLDLMRKETGCEPAMWGESMVGFGSYHYRYASGREGDWFVVGFSPRKRDLTLYLMCGLEGHDELLAKLGKHKRGKACLYVKRLADIHLPTLRKLVKISVARARKSEGK